MSLLIAMLPIYLLGNLHCIGMCGPLVMLLSKSNFRHFYFLGRLLSFTLAGTIAGGLGEVLNVVLTGLKVPALTSFLFGSIILACGIFTAMHKEYPGYRYLAKWLMPLNQQLSLALLKDKPLPSFLFGFFTILLPCGQTLIVYSACALSGSLWVGTINGFAFALLTSPALALAMQAEKALRAAKKHYNQLVGLSAVAVGILALLRGLADIGIIEHFVLNSRFHIIIY